MTARHWISYAISICLLSPIVVAQDQGDPFNDPFAGKAKKATGIVAAHSDPFANPAAARERMIVAGTEKASPAQAELMIRVALDHKTTLDAVETPLEDLLNFMSQSHKIPIVIDRRSLEEMGLAPDQQITISLKNISLRSALRLVLDEMDLTYAIRDEVLLITTQEAAGRHLRLNMYCLPESLSAKSDEVVEVLMKTVEPDEWDSTGGASTIAAIDNVLVVSAKEDMHARVEDFFEKLMAAFEK